MTKGQAHQQARVREHADDDNGIFDHGDDLPVRAEAGVMFGVERIESRTRQNSPVYIRKVFPLLDRAQFSRCANSRTKCCCLRTGFTT